MSKILVVFGATGNQGSSVIDHVLQDPELTALYTIRAVTRDTSSPRATKLASQGIQLVQGDPSNKASLGPVFKGAHTVFATTNSKYDGTAHAELQEGKDMVDVAIAEGVQYYIWSTLPSPNAISGGKYTKVVGFDDKYGVEEYIRSKTTLKSAFYAPGSFMQNYNTMMKPRPSYENDGSFTIARLADPSSPLPLVDIAGDTGKFVGAILADPSKYEGKTFCGATKQYSMDDQAAIISKVTGKTVKYVQVPQDIFQSFLPPALKDELVEMLQYIQEYGYYGPDTVARLEWSIANARGKLTTFEEYLDQNPMELEG